MTVWTNVWTLDAGTNSVQFGRKRAKPLRELGFGEVSLCDAGLDRHDRTPEAGLRKPTDGRWNSWEDPELVKTLDENWRDQRSVQVKKDSLRH